MTNEDEQFKKNNIVKDANIKESIEEPKEIKSPNWFDKNKFKNILAIIDSNKFNCRHKIGEFKYNDNKDWVNNIGNNTISEIFAKKDLNTLNELKTAEIMKYKKSTSKQKELLNLFNDLLETIFTDKALKLKNQKDDENKNENENVNENVHENENVNENDKTLMSSDKDDVDYENENETINQNNGHKI